MKKINLPNANNLISSLRNTGYDNYSAICDIIDNAIDARAKKINIEIRQENSSLYIFVADNGLGMDKMTLDEALKLGSESEKDNCSDLGKFGTGLSLTSISLSKKLEVITKTNRSELHYSSQDLDAIEIENEFIKELRLAINEEIDLFKKNIPTDENGKDSLSGTLVILKKIDRITNTNISQFSDVLRKKISQTYRKFINSGIEFTLNESRIESFDPLMNENKGTTSLFRESYSFTTVNGESKDIDVKMVLLPDFTEKINKEKKINLANQGFYILRNNREIAHGESLNVFSKHIDFNRLRIEISFDSSLDSEMGITFMKDEVHPNQSIVDILKREINGQLLAIKKLYITPMKNKEFRDVNHSESENVIAKKAKLLMMPNGNTVRFENVSLGKSENLYDYYQDKKAIVIRWNIDHPFYEEVITSYASDEKILSALDYLIFALVSAEFKTNKKDSIEILNSIKSIVSSNLRTLMS